MPSRALLVAATVLAVWLMACGPTPAQVNNSGHEPYQSGDYAAALDAYQLALERSPKSGEPYYNSGNVLYRTEGVPADPEQIYDESLRFAKGELRARGFFNRGNASFQREEYTAAVGAYKEVLRMNPDDGDAKHNLELALRQSPPQGQDEEQEEEQQDEEQEEDEQEQDEEQEEQEQDQPLTVEQARQILESVGESAQTLQQRRGQVLVSPKPPSEFDW